MLLLTLLLLVLGAPCALGAHRATRLAVGSFTERSFLDAKGVGITFYKLVNTKLVKTGTLGPSISGPNPGYLAIHPPFIYALNSEPGSITRISFFTKRRPPKSITTLSNTLSNAHVAELPKRGIRGSRIVLMASFRGNVTSYISSRSSLKLVDTFSPDQEFASEVGPFQSQPRPHMIMPYRGTVLVPDLGSDRIWHLKVTKRGRMKVLGATELKPGDGPRHVAVHPSGFVYLANQLSNTVVLLKEECGDGLLGECERREVLDIEAEPAAIRISQDGKYVYVSVRPTGDPEGFIVGFEVDGTGKFVQKIGQWGSGGIKPRDFFLIDSGIAVVNRDSNDLVVFERNEKTGMIGGEIARTEVGTPVSVISF